MRKKYNILPYEYNESQYGWGIGSGCGWIDGNGSGTGYGGCIDTLSEELEYDYGDNYEIIEFNGGFGFGFGREEQVDDFDPTWNKCGDGMSKYGYGSPIGKGNADGTGHG